MKKLGFGLKNALLMNAIAVIYSIKKAEANWRYHANYFFTALQSCLRQAEELNMKISPKTLAKVETAKTMFKDFVEGQDVSFKEGD